MMLSRVKHFSKYLLYALFATALYGFVTYYFIYKQFAEFSLLSAYIINMIVIILSLALDSIIHGALQSKKFEITKKNYRFARYLYMDSYISVRTTVYLFYIFVLVASQILSFSPTPVNEDIGNFIITVEYGILFVIAFDTLIGAIFKDMERIKSVSAKFEKFLSGCQGDGSSDIK